MKSVFSEEYSLLLRTLVDARKDANITQTELAAKLGRPQSFVSKYERGERRLDVVEFIHVSRYLGVNAAELVKDISETASTFKPEDAA